MGKKTDGIVAIPINQLDTQEARWFAIYTGFRKEKKVCELLGRKNIHAYLPLQSYTRHYTRKTKQVELPLISCYVFVCITQAQYVAVLETAHVYGFVRQRKDLLAIPEAEIALLKRIVGEIEVEAATTSLHEGAAVEIIGGQLTGLQGILTEIRGEKKLVVNLQSLGYDLVMEVSPKYVRKINRLAVR